MFVFKCGADTCIYNHQYMVTVQHHKNAVAILSIISIPLAAAA